MGDHVGIPGVVLFVLLALFALFPTIAILVVVVHYYAPNRRSLVGCELYNNNKLHDIHYIQPNKTVEDGKVGEGYVLCAQDVIADEMRQEEGEVEVPRRATNSMPRITLSNVSFDMSAPKPTFKWKNRWKKLRREGWTMMEARKYFPDGVFRV